MSDTVIVVSDLHLGRGDDFDIFAGPGKSKDFTDFVDSVGRREGPIELVINGDFVDFLQLEPWGVKIDRAEATRKVSSIVATYKDSVLRVLREFLVPPDHKLTILLGNHDIELAFPEVWQPIATEIQGTNNTQGRFTSVAIEKQRISYVRSIGGVLVHIEHGNVDDPYNGMNYNTLFQDTERRTTGFDFPPGTRLVYEIMNRHKREFRFVDLLKPEVPAVPLLLLALKPKAVVDLPGIGIKSIAALGNGFVGWLRTKIAGPTLGRAGQAPPTSADENQLSKDMAAAYQDATNSSDGIRDSEATMLHLFLESSGESETGTAPALGPRIDRVKKSIAEAAIRSLGRPVELEDTTYYYLDHRDRDDVKWAHKRLEGDIKIVVFGHTHRPLKTEFEGDRLYLNSGAWANQITLPGPSDDVSEWSSRLRTNDSTNRVAFPTYVTLTAEAGGVSASLNVWRSGEKSLWRKHIPT